MSDFVDAVSTGSLRDGLVAIRDRIADELSPTEHVSGCECECGPPPASGRDVSALAKELRAVIEQIDKLPSGEVVSPLDQIAAGITDELAERRAHRGAGPPGPGRP